MKSFIQWTGPAFRELEVLPEKLAFEIIRMTDLLASLPQIGPDLGSRFRQLAGLRQLLINRRWRVIYEFDEDKGTVWILAVQNCSQKLPAARSLFRRKRQG
jgi:mRNA-degrading endonuclease RelE of RelBE toxin-antitoxin system